MNYNHFLKIASECAKNACYCGPSRAKIGCIAVYHGTILVKGWNSDKTQTDQARVNYLRFNEDHGQHYYPHKIHAEQSVLSRIKFLDIDFSKVTLFIYREYKSGKFALARPCKSCEKAIRDLGIKTVVYTTDGGYAIEKYL